MIYNFGVTSLRSVKDKREALVLTLFIFLAFLAYHKSFSARFIYDDYKSIVDNPFIRHLDPASLWSYDPSRFLTNFIFALNYAFGGLHPTGWHVVNLLLHIGCAFLLYRFVLLLLQMPNLKKEIVERDRFLFALSIGLIFLLHPIQTQAVIYVVQRATLLCTLFIVSSLFLYLRARLTESYHLYLWAIVLAYLGMVTKPLTMILPLLITVVEICGFGIDKKINPRYLFIYLLLCVPLLVIPFVLLGLKTMMSLAQVGYQVASWSQHLLTQMNVLLMYWRLLLIPVYQNLDYDFPIAQSLFEFPTILSFLVIVCFLILTLRLFSQYRLLGLGVMWFFIALGQVIIFPLGDIIFEHWLYLPMFGFALGFSAVVYKILRSNEKFAMTMAVIVFIMLILTYQRATVWGDEIALLKDAVLKSPRKARVHNNLGVAYFNRGELEEAGKSFRTAVDLNPDYSIAYNNLALVYLEQRRFADVKQILERLIRLYPVYPDPYVNLANMYQKLGDDDNALKYFDLGWQRDPYNAAIYTGLGNIYQNKKSFVRAREAYQRAIWLKPESPLAFYNLGNVYFKEGNFFEALQYYEKALKIQPHLLEAYVNAGNIYFYFGDFKAAIEEYRKAVTQNTNLPEAYYNLANALYETGAVQESKEHIRKAIVLYEQQGEQGQADRLKQKLNELN